MLLVGELDQSIAFERARQLGRLPRLGTIDRAPKGQRPVPRLAVGHVRDRPGQKPTVIRIHEHRIHVVEARPTIPGRIRSRLERAGPQGTATRDGPFRPRSAAVARHVEIGAVLHPGRAGVDPPDLLEARRQRHDVGRARQRLPEEHRRSDQGSDDRRRNQNLGLAKCARQAETGPVADRLQHVEGTHTLTERVGRAVRRADPTLELLEESLLKFFVSHRTSSRAARSRRIE